MFLVSFHGLQEVIMIAGVSPLIKIVATVFIGLQFFFNSLIDFCFCWCWFSISLFSFFFFLFLECSLNVLVYLCVCTALPLNYSMLVYSYLPTPPLGKDMTQGQFLSGVQQVLSQSFPSPRLVASPRLKNLVCPTIYP